MAQLRRSTGMSLACGQNEGLWPRFRDLLVNQSIDYAQPNVCITGGYTQCLKIAGLAASFKVSVRGHHNIHLQAAVANGSLVEHHYLAVELCKLLYDQLPEPQDGWLALPDRPGLALNETATPIRNSLDFQCRRAKG